MEASASKNMTSVLARGFRLSGLVPWDPSVHDDASFAASDFRLGIQKGDAAIKAAKARGVAASSEIIDAVLRASMPEGAQKLEELAKSKREARLAAAAGKGKTDDGPIDDYGAVLRNVYTSVEFQEAAAAKISEREAAEKVAKAKAAARAAGAAQNRALKSARSVAWKLKLENSAKVKQAKRDKMAALAAARATKTKGAAPKRARVPDDDDGAYTKIYAPRRRM